MTSDRAKQCNFVWCGQMGKVLKNKKSIAQKKREKSERESDSRGEQTLRLPSRLNAIDCLGAHKHVRVQCLEKKRKNRTIASVTQSEEGRCARTSKWIEQWADKTFSYGAIDQLWGSQAVSLSALSLYVPALWAFADKSQSATVRCSSNKKYLF